MQSLVHDSVTTISDDKIILHDFLVILKQILQNYQKILKKCIVGTTWTAMLSIGSNLQSHTGVLPVAKVITTTGTHETFSILSVSLETLAS